eukprot:361077-Chlamydomonas_euryale.AAC.3
MSPSKRVLQGRILRHHPQDCQEVKHTVEMRPGAGHAFLWYTLPLYTMSWMGPLQMITKFSNHSLLKLRPHCLKTRVQAAPTHVPPGGSNRSPNRRRPRMYAQAAATGVRTGGPPTHARPGGSSHQRVWQPSQRCVGDALPGRNAPWCSPGAAVAREEPAGGSHVAYHHVLLPLQRLRRLACWRRVWRRLPEVRVHSALRSVAAQPRAATHACVGPPGLHGLHGLHGLRVQPELLDGSRSSGTAGRLAASRLPSPVASRLTARDQR